MKPGYSIGGLTPLWREEKGVGRAIWKGTRDESRIQWEKRTVMTNWRRERRTKQGAKE